MKTGNDDANGVADLQGRAPQLMCELTALFIDAKDLNARVKIRARMKAVLDFISVDTSYPPIDPKQTQGIGAPGQYLYPGDAMVGGGHPLLAPGADNTLE